MFKNAVTKQFSFTFYLSLFVVMSIVNAIESTMSTLIMGFFSTRTTRKNGASGTYITFLTTITNLGHIYPTTIALYLINFFSQKSCSLNNVTNKVLELNVTIVTQITKNTCANKVKEKVRTSLSFYLNFLIYPLDSKISISSCPYLSNQIIFCCLIMA